MLQFLCPSGHKIHCPDGQAGRAAKCPKCGVAFKVPTDEQLASENLVTAEVASSISKGIEEASAGKASVKKEPQIEFLCPNGHRLHGPASMQGHAGQCPECGSKFRIPSYDDSGEEEESPPTEELDESEEAIDQEPDDAVDVIHDAEPEAADDEDEPQPTPPHPVEVSGKAPRKSDGEATTVTTARPATTTGPHPWADLLTELWMEKTAGVVIEVLLDDGEMLVPERFAVDASGQYVLLVVKNANGTYTLSTVGWQSVVRIVVRGLKRLPETYFGEM